MGKIIFIAGNWKMNKTVDQTVEFFKNLEDKLIGFNNTNISIVIFPSFISLDAANKISNKVKVGAQNLHTRSSGAYTGEVSPVMLKDICEYVLIGHSERRHIFKENNELINKKVKIALEYGLKPVLCMGETKEERTAQQTFEVLRTQINSGLKDLSANQIGKLIFAYEPVWAIGTGDTATPDQAQNVHKFIRELLKSKIKNPYDFLILYGGSVKPDNCFQLLSQPDIDGALIGGASLQVEVFFDIIQKSNKVELS